MSETTTGLLLYAGFMLVAMSIASLPLAPATFLAVKYAHPVVIAVIAAAAAALASVFDHWFVRRAFKVPSLAKLRAHRIFHVAESWVARMPTLTTFAFAAIPVPFTVIRILAPLSGLALTKYVAAVAAGRFVRIAFIATFGAWLDIPTKHLFTGFAVSLVVAAAVALARRLQQRGRARARDRREARQAASGEAPPRSEPR